MSQCPFFNSRVPLQVERLLSSANNWQFDVFKLADATQDHALSTLAFFLFHQADLIRKFDIKPHLLARFIRRVEDGYRPNPYHSKIHAADVLQSLHVIIHRGGLSPGYVDPLTLMACYLAAVVHDYEHGGVTNDYLINSSDLLALRYNDRAPLENHHLAAAFTLLKKPEYAFMSHLPKADTDRLRKMVIELVLATDMKQHFAILSHFTTVHRLGAANSVTPSHIVIPLDENERILSLQMALKCSDLGHVSASLPVHCRWVQLLEEEFFRQGDMEKLHSLPVSPLFDRCKPGITKSQVGFFDIVVIPLLNCFSRVFSNTKPLLTYTMRNYKYWADLQKMEQAVGNGNTSGK
ncbi:3'5'-cyclic nucleotide phosphodiesterase [Volvox carteri f. nagariensis]|uniref:3'5'-cyclic nucleotide phosphodiesterase n=1 Tax=Volvox carteri f. nagariensis TaxID=3068 RepID=D8TTV8_VOLCA|nr:3'5'-cyclic nucleotide phosphodiesterase [Volvox carteri f. nagariensis]EFJ48932.1 3'5'-cyclic nucleotide phosphodiesterase [Volvox carteri f. nagariensis]|eukprot:XP_002949829.1 3'5'-cyclic nucleotide phosphodiesterase [Volvox carteri f. nagariensis]